MINFYDKLICFPKIYKKNSVDYRNCYHSLFCVREQLKMDDCPKIVLKKLCCTCLSQDRKLSQLCRLKEGINHLYLLLSHDTEAYREGFFKDTASWYICWECWAIMTRISKFRSQACAAQRQLTDILEGRTDFKLLKACLSHLTVTQIRSSDLDISEQDIDDNFIDCGLDIKTETEEDIPLSLLHNVSDPDDGINSDEPLLPQIIKNESGPVSKKRLKKVTVTVKKKKKLKASNENQLNVVNNKQYFCTAYMNDIELNERISKLKLDAVFAEAHFKCESCVEVYNSKFHLDNHITQFHIEKEKHKQCDICLIYVRNPIFAGHRLKHYAKHVCQLCDYIAYSIPDISEHLKIVHGYDSQTLCVSLDRIKSGKNTPKVLNPGSKLRRNRPMLDKRTPYGYLCPECDKYFENKNLRYKHIYKEHREGYKCATCDKRFSYNDNLKRHELTHQKSAPREECPVCHKMVRVDLMKRHATIHTERDSYECIECVKTFVSRESYEHHLKYTQVHSTADILKHKCSICDKGYKSPGELRNHINYNHKKKTQHKCPICGKALATPRCVTRHVKRAHDGVKEKKDKICQQCGKAFRLKRTLREHEFIHTGERPLSCEICGDTFRQSASLYTHKKRVHKLKFDKKIVTLLESSEGNIHH